MRSFSPCCNIETQEMMWSCFKNHQQMMSSNNEPQVFNSVFLATQFAIGFQDDVKKVTF